MRRDDQGAEKAGLTSDIHHCANSDLALDTRDNYSGTGIGLAICKKTSTGTLAESEPGRVCRFMFTIPQRADCEQ
jgi:light-regulated signal transduction histidine kinase (bacteriophytochrome)